MFKDDSDKLIRRSVGKQENDSINLKNTVIISGQQRTNNMKLKRLDNGAIQIWINNGNHYAAFRWTADQVKEIIEFSNAKA